MRWILVILGAFLIATPAYSRFDSTTASERFSQDHNQLLQYKKVENSGDSFLYTIGIERAEGEFHIEIFDIWTNPAYLGRARVGNDGQFINIENNEPFIVSLDDVPEGEAVYVIATSAWGPTSARTMITPRPRFITGESGYSLEIHQVGGVVDMFVLIGAGFDPDEKPIFESTSNSEYGKNEIVADKEGKVLIPYLPATITKNGGTFHVKLTGSKGCVEASGLWGTKSLLARTAKAS